MIRPVLLFALAVLVAPAATARQIAWTEVTGRFGGLPPSIRVFEGEDVAAGLKAWLVEADPEGNEWVFDALLSGAGTETVTSFAARTDAFVALNGGFFDGASGTSYSFVARWGNVLSQNIGSLNRSGVVYYPTRGAFGEREDGPFEIAWIYATAGETWTYPAPNPNAPGSPAPRPSETWPEGGAPWPVVAGIGGGPVLVRDGAVHVTFDEEVFFGGSGLDLVTRRPRTVLGLRADGTLLAVVFEGDSAVSSGATLPQAASALVDLGAVDALNLDGGGSSTLVVADSLLRPSAIAGQRSVASAVVLRPARSGDLFFFDTGDACCYREEGAWFDTANPGYFAGTPSRLNETGSGGDRAVFVLRDIPEGPHWVYAWWVPAPNRAVDTPFDVYHRGVPTRVRLDQRTGGGEWNVIGEFDLAPGDSVVVSDDATGATSPAFVVADAIQVAPWAVSATEPRPDVPASMPELYPNPARDYLTVRSVVGGEAEIVDLLGRVVLRFAIPGDGSPARVALPRLAPGLYAVRTSVGARTFVVRP